MNSKKNLAVPSRQAAVLGGRASIKLTSQSGSYWQFYMWVPGEKQNYRRSLKTKDFDIAMERAEDLCIKLRAEVLSGRKLFGVTVDELVEQYLSHRSDDVRTRTITAEHLGSLKTYIRYLAQFKGKHTPVAELHRDSLLNYAQLRRIHKPNVQDVTIKNEQAAINALMKFAYWKKYTGFETFHFAKLQIKDVGRRDTFTFEEFRALYEHMRTWSSDPKLTADRLKERALIQDCILFAASSMLRVGEFRQLGWGDIEEFSTAVDERGKPVVLVTIKIRAETSKTGAERTITTPGGEYLQRLKARSLHSAKNDYIFHGAAGAEMLAEKRWNKVWAELMSAIGIDYRPRKLTWYSLRHFAITRSLAAGNPYYHVARIAGTSPTYIHKHYGHFDQSMSRQAALKVPPDGNFDGIVPICAVEPPWMKR